MLLAPYYREYELPWEGDEEASARFRKILRVLLIVFVLLGILFPLLPTPKPTATETEVPTRLARVMIEEKPKPPPPPPPVPKVEEKPKVQEIFSDTREQLRAFFEVDRRWVALAALKALADEGAVPASVPTEALRKYQLDSDKPAPWTV